MELAGEQIVAVQPTMQNAKPLAVVLGLNEIASAVAVKLHNKGYAVMMADDPARPVIRRGMAFFDALYDGRAMLGGVPAVSVDSILGARFQVRAHECISVTRLDISELLIVGNIDVLIDARMHADAVTPQLRRLARFAIGVGRGFVQGVDCDATIPADCPDAVPARSMRKQALVMRSPVAGHWHTPLDIGVRIYKGFPLGYLGSTVIRSPVDGILRGIPRDDTKVPFGAELIEISTGAGGGRWWGLDAQGVRIGEKVHRALQSLGAEAAVPSAKRLRLVHSR